MINIITNMVIRSLLYFPLFPFVSLNVKNPCIFWRIYQVCNSRCKYISNFWVLVYTCKINRLPNNQLYIEFRFVNEIQKIIHKYLTNLFYLCDFMINASTYIPKYSVIPALYKARNTSNNGIFCFTHAENENLTIL